MGFTMPTDRFRMARIHPGHNGPPLLHNVIPDLTLDRVKSFLLVVLETERVFSLVDIKLNTYALFDLK